MYWEKNNVAKVIVVLGNRGGPEMQKLMETPSSWELILAAFMGALGGGLFNLGVWLYVRPKLKLQHIHNQVGQRKVRAKKKPIHVDTLDGPLLHGFRKIGSDQVFIRMMAENTGKKSADRCRGFLVNIEFEPMGGERSRIFYDSLPLIWSYDIDHSMPEVDIPRGAWFTLDIFSTKKGSRQFVPCLNPMPIDYKFEAVGKYYLTIVLTAQNAKVIQETMIIDWKGKWDDFAVNGYDLKIAEP